MYGKYGGETAGETESRDRVVSLLAYISSDPEERANVVMGCIMRKTEPDCLNRCRVGEGFRAETGKAGHK